ncbi:MAG TPA: ATP-dependent helicase, partial [Myxococcaceae bacterium]|nr:ATP-dependent helicase [Myxococcaceae bacterium]
MSFPFDSEAALSRWLAARSLAHLSRVSLSTLAPQIEPAFQPQARNVLSRLRLVEVLHREGLDRWVAERGPGNRLRREVPELARKYVEAEHADLLTSRHELARRLNPPDHPLAARLHAVLRSLREQLPQDLAPRTDARLALLGWSLPTEPPGFLIREAERSELPADAPGGFILPEVRLTLEAGAVTHRCTCGLTTCVHLLAAIDAVLLRLQQTPDPAWIGRMEAMLQPPWQRALQAMERAVSAASGAQGLSWRLDVIEGFGVEVFPYVHRAGRKGRLSAGARVSRRRLLQDHAELLTADDARIASLLPEGTTPASHALLLALVDHPGLVLDEAPELPVRVERAQVGVVAVARGEGLALTFGVDGSPLPDAHLERLRKRPPEEGQFLWEPGRRILTVLEVPRTVRALLPVLHQHAAPFPPESHAELLEQLTAMAGRAVPVSLPQHVMGEAVPPQQRPVLRFEAQPGGAVRLEVRVRAIENGPLHLPGEGSRDVHARADGRTLHAVRNFARELEVARALTTGLPLRQAEEDPSQDFVYRFASPLGALELLHAAKMLEPPPEVEWAEGPPHIAPGPGLGALKVVLERKREWFGVMGGLSVHGERVELARLLEATRRKERFVPIGARGYLELEGALLAQLEKLADHVHTSRHGLELGPSAAQALAELEDAGAQVEADTHWRQLVERIFAAQELEPELPHTLKATLRSYQHDGFRWLMRL